MIDTMCLRQLDPHIGALELQQVHIGALQEFIAKRHQHGVKTWTINLARGVVRRILSLWASERMDEAGLTWLAAALKIKLFPVPQRESGSPVPPAISAS
jgi:hypothetical protein